MNQYRLLALDESGKASYEHPSELFVLSGVIIPEKLKQKLDNQMRKLKKKFFDNEDLVFHSRDMSRRKGPFAALRDRKIEIDFWSRFTTIANNSDIALFFIVADKKKAKKEGWQPKTILKKSYLKILDEFAGKYLAAECGKIILESDPSQDVYLIQAHNRLQSTGTSDGKISAKEYRTKVTSLSLVNKSNLDIDIQMADALAPIVGLIYKNHNPNKQRKLNKVEKMKARLVERKLRNNTPPSILENLL